LGFCEDGESVAEISYVVSCLDLFGINWLLT